jgi:hypothetical protein
MMISGVNDNEHIITMKAFSLNPWVVAIPAGICREWKCKIYRWHCGALNTSFVP